jgi:hypothetical protein
LELSAAVLRLARVMNVAPYCVEFSSTPIERDVTILTRSGFINTV